MTRIYLGLGSNVGDRESHLRAAVQSLRDRGVNVSRTASLYSTEPTDVLDQPRFLNTVLEANTDLKPDQLLTEALNIEHEAGRVRDRSKGPRPIDIDILIYGESILNEPGLTVPHPRYPDRRFVLVPLVELIPEFRDPIRNKTVRELLDECEDQSEVSLYAPPLL